MVVWVTRLPEIHDNFVCFLSVCQHRFVITTGRAIRCQREGVGFNVNKCFHSGRILDLLYVFLVFCTRGTHCLGQMDSSLSLGQSSPVRLDSTAVLLLDSNPLPLGAVSETDRLE